MGSSTLTKQHVESIFSHLTSGNSTAFFANVLEDVDWTVTGSSHPLARRWTSKEKFFADSWGRIGGIMKTPMQLSVVSVLVSGDTAVVELRGVGGVLKNGM